MAAPLSCGHFLMGPMTMDKCEQGSVQGSVQGDKAANVISSIIIAGIVVMFGYGIFGWILFG